ncbi:MAG TPA: ribbon-helix-helix protein, CopG family [Gaiellaceae bacterium]|jgi:hypothetical protein
MVRKQIQFTDEQVHELRRLARDRGVSVSAVVRSAVERELAKRDEGVARLLGLVGKYRGGPGNNAAEEHDRYLEEAYLDWQR